MMRRATSISLLFIALATAACEHQVLLQSPSAAAPIRGISVTGEGEASAAPDIARVTIGVEARDASAQAAAQQMITQMKSVLAALKRAGVADKDLRTTGLSLMREEHYPHEPPPPPISPPAPFPAPGRGGKPLPPGVPAPAPAPGPIHRYRAVNTVEAVVRNLDSIGNVIGAGLAAGGNRVEGIVFDIDDRSTVQRRAREKAVQDARKRAAHLANLTGVELGPVVSVTEIAGVGYPMGMPAGGPRLESANVPIERGQLTIHQTVQVVFALPEP